jgi:hypothetical protein
MSSAAFAGDKSGNANAAVIGNHAEYNGTPQSGK